MAGVKIENGSVKVIRNVDIEAGRPALRPISRRGRRAA